MKPASFARRILALLGGFLLSAEMGMLAAPPDFSTVTNIPSLRRIAPDGRRVICAVRLEGVVCAANSGGETIALQDDSGAAILEMPRLATNLSPGDQIVLESAHCAVAFDDLGWTLNKSPVVDDDGIHPMLTQRGKIYLEAGPHPLRLVWFNGGGEFGLRVSCQKPDGKMATLTSSDFAGGLNYQCYQGDWIHIASGFGESRPVKTGHASNFDLSVKTRNQHVGLVFTGLFEAPKDGLYSFKLESDDGSLLFMDQPAPRMQILEHGAPPFARNLMVGAAFSPDDEAWSSVEGTVVFCAFRNSRLELQLRANTGMIDLTVADGSGLSAESLLNRRVRAEGVARRAKSLEGPDVIGSMAVVDAKNLSVLTSERGAAEKLPLLTTGDQVKSLKRAEAERGYPVRLRGVITRSAQPWNNTMVIQDGTRGVFAQGLPDLGPAAPQFGEYWEIEGTTAPGDFAPVINWRGGRRLGIGRLPQPVAATWDQLINGSLDTQYVDIQGVVTAVRPNSLQLLLPEGKINLGFLDRQPGGFGPITNALVRVRGCLFAAWHKESHRLIIGDLNMAGSAISVEEPPPADVFSTPAKQIANLLVFDAGAGALKRVKVTGQYLGARRSQYFLTDGANGLRFQLQSPANFGPGDVVEVVGFPKLEGSSPLLREAIARKTGHAPLPEARMLQSSNWLDPGFDATRVQIDGLLMDRRTERGERVLELQSGLRTFVAPLGGLNFDADTFSTGSKLRLTGVYLAQGGNRALHQGIDAFEILLMSPEDITVLAQAPWLTLPRLLAALGGVALVLLVAMLWALSLRRQVRRQTAIIRQTAQREAALEERARIARDIHDDVGSNLTSIMMLGERSREDIARPRDLVIHTDKIVSYARATVQALDEIVWAINPQNDTVDALIGYLNQYASQFFENTNVRCRLDIPGNLSSLVLPSEERHELFLVVKEALNNILKHARATEVVVAASESSGILKIVIEDNGTGFETRAGNGTAGDGLKNMRKRMAKIGGAVDLESAPNKGTRLTLTFRLGAASYIRTN